MLATTTHSLRRGLFTTALLVALALLPSLSPAEETKKKGDAPSEAKQQVARERPTVAREALRRPEGLGTQAARAATRTPLPDVRGQVGRDSSAPLARAQDQRTVMPPTAQPRADPYGYQRQPREVGASQARERTNPYQWQRQSWDRTAAESPSRTTTRQWTGPGRAGSDTAAPERRLSGYYRELPSADRGQERESYSRTNPYQVLQPPRADQARATPDSAVRGTPGEGLARRVAGDVGTPRSRVTEQAARSRIAVPRPSGEPGAQRSLTAVPRPDRVGIPSRVREQVEARTQERARPGAAERRLSVPEAAFRGPGSEERVRTVPSQERDQLRLRLRERVREQNSLRPDPTRTRPGYDLVGNPIPGGTGVLLRDRISRLSVSYGRLHPHFGAPGHAYLVTPRRRADYWDGYWDGYSDGYWAGRHFKHRPSILVSFYYGFYFSDPLYFAFYYPGYYPAIYHYWGWCPGWIYPARVYYYPVEYVYVPVTPYRYYTGYSLDHTGAARAISDIRRGWLDGDIGLLGAHLTDELDIRVYFDGEYSYTTSTEDYYAMTLDTMATIQTVAMTFDEPIWLSSGEVFYTGRHVLYDPDGYRQTVYVSYRMRKLGGEWYIVAVGSSLEPIRHQYTDFRYS